MTPTGHRGHGPATRAPALVLGVAIALQALAGQAARAADVAVLASPMTAARASTPASGPLTAARVEAALRSVKEDPLLPGTRREKVLRWKVDDEAPEKKPPAGDRSALAEWLLRFAESLSETSRLLVYGLGLVAIAVVAVTARHLFLARRDARQLRHAARVVSHVGALDVRPDSLPEDIGATARALWARGDADGALSLLYRGALSRLIHRFDVPLDDASTEGESLALARPRVATATHAWLAGLVQGWQGWRYGGRAPDDARVHAWCEGFETHLRGPSA